MSASLSVLAPVAITTSMLIGSTAPEADAGVYDPARTYALNERCISIATHRIYESAVAGNHGNDPTNINNRVGSVIYWNDIGPTNRWAMFDGEGSTLTTVATPLTVVLKPGALNSIFLAGIDATSLSISIKDKTGGTVIWSAASNLEGSAPGDYYEYFFDRFKQQTDYLASDIPPYSGCEVTVTLSKVSGTVSCGVLAVGDLRPIGLTQYGAKAKPKSFSFVDVDKYGNNTIQRGKKAKDMTASAFVDLAEANTVLDTVTELLDVPCVWVGTDLAEYSGLRVFGLGSGEMSYDYTDAAMFSLTVQGLI
jgi:hypothetical protein